jgi:hypothetical protein
MKLVRTLVLCAVAIAPAAFAQKWEFGGGAGGGFYSSQDVSSPSGSAAATIQTNVAGSVWFDNNSSGRWGGELRSDYQRGALQLSSNGTQATFASQSYTFHYDLLWHFTPPGSKVRPFVAAGGGIKTYLGNGNEVVYQQLSNIALLTKAQDLTPMVSVGVGLKVQVARRVQLRFDFHDYLTPFPTKVITPNTGAKVSGWLQDFVPMVGLSFTASPEE